MFRKNTNLYLSVILIAVIAFSLMTIYAASSTKHSKGFGLSARSAVLYQPETKAFLYEKNADVRMPMASTTKIMTALVALENGNLDDTVKIGRESVGIEGSSAYLKEGDALTLEELIYALLLSSANDAATAIAYHISGSIEDFAVLMNERADALGLKDTHFTNPHGLDDENHYTTSRELARIAAEALENEDFKKITSTYKKSFVTEERSRTYVNHNKLLSLYDGCVGVKTGFTKKSGRCLVSSAERDGLSFISVTLDAPNDWIDHEKLLDYGYDTLEKITLAEVGEFAYEVKLIGGVEETVFVKNTEKASVILDKGEHDVKKYIKLPRFTTPTVKSGDVLGEVIFTVDGEYAASVKLYAQNTVTAKKDKGIFKKIISKFHL